MGTLKRVDEGLTGLRQFEKAFFSWEFYNRL
jgi:hypothetical protein